MKNLDKTIVRYLCLVLCVSLGGWLHAQNGIVIGSSEAPGQHAFAAGDSSLAQGYASIAAGNKALAIGDFTLSLGDQTQANGSWSQALGFGSRTDADYGLGVGFFNFITQPSVFGIGIGAANHVNGFGAMAIGRDNFSLGSGSIVLGARSTARTYGEVVLGNYAEDYVPQDSLINQYGWSPLHRLFVVANGSGDGAGNGERSNALVMLKNGDTDLAGNLKLQKSLTVGVDTTQVDFQEGQIRYNPESNDLEGYAQSQWMSLTGLSSASVEDEGSWFRRTGAATGASAQRLKSIGGINQFLYSRESIKLVGATLDNVMRNNNALDIYTFDWSIENKINLGSISPAGDADRARFGAATVITNGSSIAINQLIANCTAGDHFDDLVVEVRTSVGGTGVTIAKYELKLVLVESVEFFLEENDFEELVRVKFQFGAIKVSNFQIGANGAPDPPTIFEWSAVLNKGEFRVN